MVVDRGVKRFVRAIALALVSVFTGVLGYHFIEDYSYVDAFYMTVITISTVGFTEVNLLSETGRLFTAFYIIFNLAVIAYIVSVITRFLFEGEFKEFFSSYMTKREVDKLEGHVIICGFGRNGSNAAKELKRDGVPFVIIDNDENVLQALLSDYDNLRVVKGDATEESVLSFAGVERASALIASIPDDANNVFITLTAREMNPNLRIIARANKESSEQKLLRAGANSVVMPDAIGGHYMATLVNRPQVVEFLDMINGVGEVKVELEEVYYEDFKSEYRGKTIVELNVREYSGVTFIGYKSTDKEYVFNPNATTKLVEGDVFIMLGKKEEIEAFKEEFLLR